MEEQSQEEAGEKQLTNEAEASWRIRPMRHEDIEKCLYIWSQVELTEAYQTVASALSADPLGFYVAELNNNDNTSDDQCTGEVVGMCAGPMTRADTAFMGFYAVEPKYQRLGIGRKLWEKTIGRLDSSINVGLYGVPSMTEKYKKSGFMIEDSTRMLIFESTIEQKLNVAGLKNINELAGCRLEKIDAKTQENVFRKLIDYDYSVQRFSREKLLRLYMRGDDVPLTVAIIKEQSRSRQGSGHSPTDQHHSAVAGYHAERKSSCCAKPVQEAIIEDEALSTNVKSVLSLSSSNLHEDSLAYRSSSPVNIPSIASSTSGCVTTIADSLTNSSNNTEEILGYGCIRRDNNNGGMIGPIYADSGDLCEVILRSLLEGFQLKAGNNIYSVMALSSNKQACKILTKVGLNEVEQCSRMFTKFVPAASFSKIYYVHSPNFTLF